jgi:uncharacterized sporulation protein YeaH/YhbH (DUF444 family)
LVHLIDRRLQGKNKSAVNRERFLRRYKSQIKDAVAHAIKGRSITDVEHGEQISIPVKDISEPHFGHSHGGVWETVRPGNREYQKGDSIARPEDGGGSGGGKTGSDSDQINNDEFIFELTKEEFINYFFEDLELPNLIKTQLTTSKEFKLARAGFNISGTPSNIHILRSLRGALCRRIAVGGTSRKLLRETEAKLKQLLEEVPRDQILVEQIKCKIHQLRTRLRGIPFIDPFDLRYSNRIKKPRPSNQAVMFCIMDVSGSMDQQKKDTAKRFFILLYLFLTRAYEQIDVMFIRHHTTATEVDENEFFHSRESGGTVVSSALQLLNKIMKDRYPEEDWNRYVAQASDGDNWDSDSITCKKLMTEIIMPTVQYYAYVEITDGAAQNLWQEYLNVAANHQHFAMQRISTSADIYPVFRELFRKQVK